MASTYSPLLRLELMTTGEKNGQWGDITNTNLASILEQAVAGTVTISITGVASSVTLTENFGVADQSRSAILYITGTNANPINIVAPALSKLYCVNNTSNQVIRLKTSASTGLNIPAGTKQIVFYDVATSDFVSATSAAAGSVTSVGVSGGTTGLTTSGGPVTTSGTITLAGTLAVANGGTGSATQGGAINNLLPSQAAQSGKFLTTNGTNVSWAVAGSGGVGTVTEIQMSGGSTGLSFTGGPITTSGTFTLGGGPLGIGFGGTGANTAGNARINLGLGSLATQDSVSLSSQVTGTLPVSSLSTGSAGQVLTMSGGTPTWATASSGGIVTAQRLSAAGNSVVSTTNIPAGVRRIIVTFDSVSTSGSDFYIGLRTVSSGVYAGSYFGSTSTISSASLWNTAVRISPNDNSDAWGGAIYFDAADVGAGIWAISGSIGRASSGGGIRTVAGFVDLSASGQVNGASVFVLSGSFDNGGITVAYEFGSG